MIPRLSSTRTPSFYSGKSFVFYIFPGAKLDIKLSTNFHLGKLGNMNTFIGFLSKNFEINDEFYVASLKS